jgi:hypothetical protein
MFIISTIQTISTLVMFGWLFKNHWHDLKRTVFFLSVSWTIWELVHYIRQIVEFSTDIELPWWVNQPIFILNLPLYGIYMLTMFRLKALEIYMDPKNISVGDIEMALTKLRCVQIAFCIF